MSAYKILLIGAGQAGLRFLRACGALESPWTIEVVGIIESNHERGKQITNQLNIPTFKSVQEAFDERLEPHAAIVTVPESSHAKILLEIAEIYSNLKIVICEKPLTHTLEEAQIIARTFEDKAIAVNFVERFSPIVGYLVDFLKTNNRHILRANCWWGKYRLKDARPTLGVISVELAHPLDLILYLCNTKPGTPFHFDGVIATASNFSTGTYEALPLDSIHASLIIDNKTQIFISSSLLWSQRDRRIELLIGDTLGKATELVSMTFDNPVWDVDCLKIYNINAQGGILQLQNKININEEDWPKEKFTIGKVCNFLEAALHIREPAPGIALPSIKDCVYLQEILTNLESTAKENARKYDFFVEPEINDSNCINERIIALKEIESDPQDKKSVYIWDAHY